MQFREICTTCRLSKKTCYCAQVKKFDPRIKFVILTHYREAQKKVATGRMAHLHIEGSELIEGYDYSKCSKVNAIINDPRNICFVLYPGKNSIALDSKCEVTNILELSKNKNLVIFVIDGTWITARKTMQRSDNLSVLPQVAFNPTNESKFLIRKQPHPHCYSTIEAIHRVITLFQCAGLTNDIQGKHDVLLETFGQFVKNQLTYVNKY